MKEAHASSMIFLRGVIVPDKNVQYHNIRCFFCALVMFARTESRASGESGGMACRMELRVLGGDSSWQSCYENRDVVS